MSDINYGNQDIVFKYRYPTKGATFTKALRYILKPGIYKGFDVTIIGSNTVSIAAGTMVINSDSERCVTMRTEEAFTLSINEANPIIYAIFTYSDYEGNYVDFLTREDTGLITNEVTLCKCNFSGGILSSIDSSYKLSGFIDEYLNIYTNEINEKTTNNNIQLNSEINVDTINENTTNNGVIIEGIRFIDTEFIIDNIDEKITNYGVSVENVMFINSDIKGFWLGGSLIGNALSISGVSIPVLTTLSSTSIAFIDNTNKDLRKYAWDGSDWSQVGNDLNLSSNSYAVITAFSDTDIAMVDAGTQTLRTYRFDGSDWAILGSALAYTYSGYATIAALSSTTIAIFDTGTSLLSTYEFNGSTWSKIGNSLSITDITLASMSALNSTDIAFAFDGSVLRTYRWDGSNWSQIGNTGSLYYTGLTFITALNSTDIIHNDTNGFFQIYRFNGVEWNQVGGLTYIGASGIVALSVLNDIDIAQINDSDGELNYIRFYKSYNSIPRHSTIEY